MALPASLKFEIEFVTGSNTWVDVSTDVDLETGYQIHYGRANQFDSATPATLSFQLFNDTGKYTPGTQLLVDGITAHPYYPNVIPRRRMRVTFVYSAVTYYRYYGYTRGFPPIQDADGGRPRVPVTASCRLFLLQNANNLLGWFQQECLLEAPALLAYYPMSDAAPLSGLGSAAFADVSGNGNAPLAQPYIGQTDYQALAAGAPDPMPQSEGATGAGFQVQDGSSTTKSGLAVTLPGITLNGTTAGFWVTFPQTVSGATSYLEFRFSSRTVGIQYCSVRIQDTGSGVAVGLGEAGTSGAITYFDVEHPTSGVPHYVQFTLEPASPGPFQMVVSVDDGPLWAEQILDSIFPLTQLEFAFQQSSSPAASGPIILGPLFVSNGTYAGGTVPDNTNMYAAGTGWAGQLTGARVTKLLTYAGYTSMLTIDTGAETLSGEQSIMGRIPLDCIQEITVTEGSGSVFYTRPDGYLEFQDRNHRANALLTTADLTVDAVKDLDGASYASAFDDAKLVVSSTVARPGGATQTYTDTVAQAAMQSNAGDSVTSLASTDAAALSLAQFRVSSQSTPAFRVDQLTIDAMTSETANIYFQMQACLVGDVVELGGLPVGLAAPGSTMRMYAEGWSENVNADSYASIYDTSPSGPSMFFTTDANFGRVSEDAGTWTLTSTITNSATSISLTTAATHPKLTNTGGDLPLYILIGTEVLQVTAVGGATSPQTLTVVRGQQNTRAAAQLSGSVITLWPVTFLAL